MDVRRGVPRDRGVYGRVVCAEDGGGGWCAQEGVWGTVGAVGGEDAVQACAVCVLIYIRAQAQLNHQLSFVIYISAHVHREVAGGISPDAGNFRNEVQQRQ